jgi:hypothetical protein
MAQDLFDHLPVVDEGNDPHFTAAVGTKQGVGFPDFLDEFAPFG